MSRSIVKISVRCPHCGSQQMESAQAKSTICRRCSDSFDITPTVIMATPASGDSESVPGTQWPSIFRGGNAAPTPAPRPQSMDSAAQSSAEGGSLRERFGKMFGGAPPKNQLARCFECSAEHEVSGAAHSSICRHCGAYIDLQDYKITGSFSRNIATRGSVVVTRNGVLSSSKIICAEAVIHGKLRGNLQCSGKVTLRTRCRLPGSLEAGSLVIEKGADVECGLPVKVTSIEIAGRMVGQIISDGHVNVLRTGFLCGPVRAKGFSVEQGGCFDGELTIRPSETITPPVTDSETSDKPATEDAAKTGWAVQPTMIQPELLPS